MIKFHQSILGLMCALVLSNPGYCEVPVVDDSENFALLEEPQTTYDQPLAKSQQDPYAEDYASLNEEPPLATEQPLAQASKEQFLSPTTTDRHQDNAMLLNKIQTLQQEVQELRGQLEVQTHDLKLLQEQQLAFYKDLDARLYEKNPQATKDLALPIPPISSTELQSNPSHNTKTTQTTSNSANKKNPAEEQISYLAAYELIKNKKYDQALAAMQTFANQYPQSGYSANAQYWLGELNLLKKDFPSAIENFETVIKQYATSSKSAACLLKLGYAYAALGKTHDAKLRLNQVIKNYPDTNTAQLATVKLQSLGS